MKRSRTHPHQANDKPLRWVLLANALFSAASGLTLVGASGAIAGIIFARDFTLFGLASTTLLFELGLGLIIFAAFVAFTARQERLGLGQVKLIVLADLLWVADSAVLLAVFPDSLSSNGFEAVLIIAGLVLLLAIEQIPGIALIYQGESAVSISARGDRMTLTASLRTRAPAERVWQVMSEHERYADVADNLSKSEVLDGRGLGLIRRCVNTKGKSWRETCTKWDEGRAFAFRVHTEAPDYPYPIAELTGEWSLDVEPGTAGTEIRMIFELQAKPGLINRLLFEVMSAPLAKLCDRLLRRWVEIMEGADPKSARSSGPQPTLATRSHEQTLGASH